MNCSAAARLAREATRRTLVEFCACDAVWMIHCQPKRDSSSGMSDALMKHSPRASMCKHSAGKLILNTRLRWLSRACSAWAHTSPDCDTDKTTSSGLFAGFFVSSRHALKNARRKQMSEPAIMHGPRGTTMPKTPMAKSRIVRKTRSVRRLLSIALDGTRSEIASAVCTTWAPGMSAHAMTCVAPDARSMSLRREM